MSDVSKEYGAALYRLAAEEDLTEALLEETDAVRTVLLENGGYIRLLSSPEIPLEERESALRRAFEGGHPYLINFLRMMVARGYSREIVSSLSEYRRLYQEEKGISPARITSAVPLDGDAQGKLVAALEKRYGVKVEPTFSVDPSLLGGVRVEINGRLLDGTVRRRLDGMRDALESLTL